MAATVGWAGAGLTLAAGLHYFGRGPMCAVIRTRAGLVGLGIFAGHLAGLLGPLDPIIRVSRRVPQRRPHPC